MIDIGLSSDSADCSDCPQTPLGLSSESLRNEGCRVKYWKKEKDEKNEEDEILFCVGFSELKGMIELNVDGGVEAIQEYHRLLKDDPDDHYFQSLSWPSSEEYRVRRKSCLDGITSHISFVPKIIAHTTALESGGHAEINGLTVGTSLISNKMVGLLQLAPNQLL